LAHYRAALRAVNRAARFAPPEVHGQICVQFGRLFDESCLLEKAEKWYRRALIYEEKGSWLVLLGAVLAKQGRLDEAMKCHERAARLATETDSPDEAYVNIAMILRAKRRYREALRYVNRALKIDKNDEDAISVRKDLQKVLRMKRRS
jgi:tetratricopeptide (TPR) repeat protein